MTQQIELGITPWEVQAAEDAVAHWRAARCVWTPKEAEEIEARDDVDKKMDDLAAVCRRIRKQGS